MGFEVAFLAAAVAVREGSAESNLAPFRALHIWRVRDLRFPHRLSGSALEPALREVASIHLSQVIGCTSSIAFVL